MKSKRVSATFFHPSLNVSIERKMIVLTQIDSSEVDTTLKNSKDLKRCCTTICEPGFIKTGRDGGYLYINGQQVNLQSSQTTLAGL